MVAVGFSPRTNSKEARVAERGMRQQPSLRDARRVNANRGLKPTATFMESLRDCRTSAATVLMKPL